jgi:hypothetical protein
MTKPADLPPPWPEEWDESDPLVKQLIYGVYIPDDGSGEEICLVDPTTTEKELSPPPSGSESST